MYVDPETIPEEEYFQETKTFIDDKKKMSTPWPATKYWPEFSYIGSEDYE